MADLEQQLLQEQQFDWSKDIQKWQAIYEKEKPLVTDDTKLNYASYLIRSADHSDIRLGATLLEELLQKNSKNREYLYFAAIANYKVEELGEARRLVSQLLEIEPSNRQATDLQKLIHNKLAKDGLLGMAITGGVVAAIGIASVLLAKGLKR